MKSPYKPGDILKVISNHCLGGSYIPSKNYELHADEIVLVIKNEQLTEEEIINFGNKVEWTFGIQLFLFKTGELTPYDGYMLIQLQRYFEIFKL